MTCYDLQCWLNSDGDFFLETSNHQDRERLLLEDISVEEDLIPAIEKAVARFRRRGWQIQDELFDYATSRAGELWEYLIGFAEREQELRKQRIQQFLEKSRHYRRKREQ